MSEKMTVVETGSGRGIQLHGHIAPEQAIRELKLHAEIQLENARQTLVEIAAGDVEVVHQRGVYVARNVVKVWP